MLAFVVIFIAFGSLSIVLLLPQTVGSRVRVNCLLCQPPLALRVPSACLRSSTQLLSLCPF